METTNQNESLRNRMPETERYSMRLTKAVAIKFPTVSQLEIKNTQKMGLAFHEMTPKEVGDIVYDEMMNVCEVYYGKNRDHIAESLINAMISYCQQHLENFTKNDFIFAFKRANIEVDQFTRLTLGSFTKYLLQWKSLKSYIIQCKQTLRKQEEQMNETEIMAQKYLAHSKQVYNDSISQNTWLGNPFMATVLVEYFKNDFNENEINEIQKKAKEKFYKIQVEIENAKGLFVPAMYTTKEKYFNEEMLKYAVEKRINKF